MLLKSDVIDNIKNSNMSTKRTANEVCSLEEPRKTKQKLSRSEERNVCPKVSSILETPPKVIEVNNSQKEQIINSGSSSLKLLEYFEKQLNGPSQRVVDDFSYFLPPPLIPIVSSKWRIVKSEKANFSDLLREGSSVQPRPKVAFSESIMRRSFLIRRREGPSSSPPTEYPFPNTGGRHIVARRLRPPLHAGAEMTPDDIREVLLPVHQRLVRLSFGKQWGNPFMKVITPENCATLRVPTYFDFVKEPMNLSWIRDKVKKAEYYSITEYIADVELVRKNAQSFNRPGDPVYAFADELMKKCREELKVRGYESIKAPEIESSN